MHRLTALEALNQYFGYTRFRPQQLAIIEEVYAGGDALVLMPTGGGKSITFQIPALTMPGTAVVVSPLIALMKDQVDGLRANGIQAACINTSMAPAEIRVVESDYESGRLDLLYVSPEKLLSAGFFSFLRRSQVALFAIDEAHCISAWGHDFRPEYTQLRVIKKSFAEVPILALTATADRLTRKDILNQLAIPDAKVFLSSFDRPNISLEVRPGRQRREQIVEFLRARPSRAGIIYCLSRKSTESLAEKLRAAGFDAQAYHAKLPAQRRAEVQQAFIDDRLQIVCATIAFGMGIDKSNVRWVIHYNLPKNLENYYQEIGRAGRDGTKADTLLFYSYQDYQTYKEMLSQGDNAEVQLAKLERIKDYAESLACRRRILLNYFSEDQGEDCGNCDVCRNPPERIDGTTIAQKALSAVARLREQVGISTLIDVLRGSQKRELLSRGYDRIKTFGAGRDISEFNWSQYLTQLINLGYLFVAHEDRHRLRLSPAAKRVLFEGETVELVNFATLKQRREADKKAAKTAKQRNPRTRSGLFEQLRELRRDMAREMGKPPYLIFSDATLEEMAALQPTTDREMARINGIGQHKLTHYAPRFKQLIKRYAGDTPPANLRKISAHEAILYAYQQGEEPAAIAARRGIGINKVMDSLAKCYVEGKDFDITQLLPTAALNQVGDALKLYHPQRDGKKAILDHIGADQVDYGQLNLALAYFERHGIEN